MLLAQQLVDPQLLFQNRVLGIRLLSDEVLRYTPPELVRWSDQDQM